MTDPSQARRRTVSGARVGAGVQPADGGARPDPVLERVEVHGQQQGGLVGLADLVPCSDGPADQGHQGVAAAPVGGAQVTFALDRPRRRELTERALEDALALHVEGQPGLERAGTGVLWLGQGDEGLPHVLLVLQHAVPPVLRQHRRAQQAAPARAVLFGHGDQALQDVRLRAVGQARPQLVRLRHHDRGRPRRQPPGLDGLLDGLVDGLAERLRERHHGARPAGPRGRGVVADPLGRGHRRRPAGGLTAVQCLPGHRDPRGLAGHHQPVDLTQQPGQALSPAAARRLPQHCAQGGQG